MNRNGGLRTYSNPCAWVEETDKSLKLIRDTAFTDDDKDHELEPKSHTTKTEKLLLILET